MKKLLPLLLFLSLPAIAAPKSLTLTWQDLLNPPPPATTYNLYRGPGTCASGPAFAQIVSGLQVLTYQDSGLAQGQYCYYATAVDTASGLESDPSNMLDVNVPHPPTNFNGKKS